MKEYLEQQLKKKAHELVMAAFRVASKAKGNKAAAISLRKIVGKIPAAIFEGQSRDFDEDKLKYFTEARSAVFESRYYLDLLYNRTQITYYSYRQIATKIDLLDKLLVSRIRAVDKRKAKEQYRLSITERYL